ncbi:retrotransposon protein, putative, ty1-copia subclass [Tanacetum coccineum]
MGIVARRGVFLEREMISKEDRRDVKIDLEEIQESADEEPIVNTDTQQEMVTPVKPDDISLPIHRKSGRSMYDNQVWNLVDTTLGLKTVGCWIFKKKTDMDGKVHTYKARIMLAIAAFHDCEIWQMDVKIAFLNGKLTTDATQSWNLCFYEKVTQFGFLRSEDESCIYVKVSGSVVVFQVLYVNDILLIGNDILMLQSVKYWLVKYYAMKDLGDASYILGIKIYRDRSKRLIGLSQDINLDKILKRFKMENSKKGNLPLHHGIKISSCLVEEERTSRDWFYYDASWQIDKDDSRSQSGWVFLLNGRAVTWKSLKQDTVAESTCESEYITACEASKKAIWIKNFIGDFRVFPTVQDLIEIFCDNKSAVALTKEPKDQGKSKHIERKYHFVRSKIEEGHVIVKHIRSEDNPADPFTKALAKSRHDKHARSIGLKDNILTTRI